MATLTADQLTAIRNKVGIEDCTPAAISDVTIQAVYDAAGSSLPLTYVELLEQLWGMAKAATVNLATGGTAVSTAKAKAIKERLDYWSRKAGLGLGSISAGVLVIPLDTPCPDDDPTCWERWP